MYGDCKPSAQPIVDSCLIKALSDLEKFVLQLHFITFDQADELSADKVLLCSNKCTRKTLINCRVGVRDC